MESDRLIVVDIETTGLDPKQDVILEVGTKVVDIRFDDWTVIDQFQVLIYEDYIYDPIIARKPEDDYAMNMHTKSGLLTACNTDRVTVSNAEKQVIEFLTKHSVSRSDPMTGSSIHFDRSFFVEHMPSVDAVFSYRNIDVSTVKELCERFNRPIWEQRPTLSDDEKPYRALQDIDATIAELYYYYQNFLWVV